MKLQEEDEYPVHDQYGSSLVHLPKSEIDRAIALGLIKPAYVTVDHIGDFLRKLRKSLIVQ